jgi:hypothetical protein
MLLYQYLPHGNQIIQFQLSRSRLLLLHFPAIIFLHLTVPPLSFLISSFPPHLFICLPWGRTGAEPQVIEVAAGWISLAFKYPIPTSKHSPHWFYKWHKMFHRSRINTGAWRRFCPPPSFFPTARLPFYAKKLPRLVYIYLQYYWHVSSPNWLLANDKHIYRRWRKMCHVTELDTCKLCVHINIQQDRRYAYNVILGPFSKTTVATERQQCVTSVLLSNTSVKNITILSVATNTFMAK